MRWNLHVKLLLFAVTIILSVGGAISLGSLLIGRAGLTDSFVSESRNVAELIAQSVVNDLYFLDVSSLRDHLEDAYVNPAVIRIHGLDPDGIVLSDGTKENPLRDRQCDSPLLKQAMEKKNWVSQVEDEVLSVFGPVRTPDERTIGYLMIEFSLKNVRSSLAGLTRSNLTLTLPLLGLGALLAFLFSRHMTRPLGILVRATHQIRRGDFNVRLSLSHKDELGELGNAFDQMAEELTKSTTSITNLQREIEERKRAEESLERKSEELEKANVELERFAYVASHDLQEPLRKITAFGDRLKTAVAACMNEENRDYFDRIQKATVRMRDLIEDLLKYSRLGTQTIPFEPVSLEAVIHEVLNDLEVAIAKSGGRVDLGPLPTIQADKRQMQQLFQNLIGNAFKFSRREEPPRVVIGGKPSGNGLVEITVQDNGIGFEEQYVDQIFEPFQRLHAREAYEGTGIGLAICKKIVERHKGTITAKSEPGKGATFIIKIPPTPPPALEDLPGLPEDRIPQWPSIRRLNDNFYPSS